MNVFTFQSRRAAPAAHTLIFDRFHHTKQLPKYIIYLFLKALISIVSYVQGRDILL